MHISCQGPPLLIPLSIGDYMVLLMLLLYRISAQNSICNFMFFRDWFIGVDANVICWTTMSILSRFFHRRAPDGLLEFVDRVYGKGTWFSNVNLMIYYYIQLYTVTLTFWVVLGKPCEICLHLLLAWISTHFFLVQKEKQLRALYSLHIGCKPLRWGVNKNLQFPQKVR